MERAVVCNVEQKGDVKEEVDEAGRLAVIATVVVEVGVR